MDHEDRIASRRKTAGLLAAFGALLAVAGAPQALGQQSVQQVTPRIQAPVRAQARVIAPRVVSLATLPQTATVTPNMVHRMAIPALLNFTVEAEDWGEMPDLGFTVQDMSGWGSEWSGNKQIFWNPQPPSQAFKWDFSVTGGKVLRVYLTAAPDYANMDITLGCYRQVSQNYYQLQSQHKQFYNGYATSVRRQVVVWPLTFDPKCASADMYRLLFVAKQSEGRTFGGIDSIVVQR